MQWVDIKAPPEGANLAPVAGADVVVWWSGERVVSIHPNSVCLRSVHTKADAQGRFSIPGWWAPPRDLVRGVQVVTSAYKLGYAQSWGRDPSRSWNWPSKDGLIVLERSAEWGPYTIDARMCPPFINFYDMPPSPQRKREIANQLRRLQGAASQSAGLSPVKDLPTDPAAFVGRPFPVSASVEDSCNQREDGCAETRTALSKFAQQPRDRAWATDTEAKLLAFMSAEPDKYTVRALECRTSLCVAEVASIYGGFPTGIPADDPLASRLSEYYYAYGNEREPPSPTITATLLIYLRR